MILIFSDLMNYCQIYCIYTQVLTDNGLKNSEVQLPAQMAVTPIIFAGFRYYVDLKA